MQVDDKSPLNVEQTSHTQRGSEKYWTERQPHGAENTATATRSCLTRGLSHSVHLDRKLIRATATSWNIRRKITYQIHTLAEIFTGNRPPRVTGDVQADTTTVSKLHRIRNTGRNSMANIRVQVCSGGIIPSSDSTV